MKRTVFHFTDSAGFGGAEQVLSLLVERLDRKRWNPTLVCHSSTGIAPLVERMNRLDVPVWSVPRMPLGGLGAGRSVPFARELRRRRPHVFHAHLTWPLACRFGLAASIAARIPAIVATQHLFLDIRMTRRSRLQQRLLARGVDRYLAVSRDTATRLTRDLGVPTGIVRFVPNAVDVARFTEAADPDLRARLRGTDDRPVVLVLARLDEQKGHRYLLEAAGRVPEARFLLVGEGPERARLEAQAKTIGVAERVRFLGVRHDVEALLACSDIVALPSLYEGLPLSVLEAMAAGKPVVATRIGGNDEAVVHGETGLLVRPRDPGALAAGIERLLRDPLLAQAMGAAGRERARRLFSAERLAAQVVDQYEEILGSTDA